MKKVIKTILQYLLMMVGSLAIAFVLRVFAVDFYSIPSDSMEPALEPGDFIMVNKLCHGARMYRNFDFLDTGAEPEMYRVKGYSSIKRNDVVVFNFLYTKGWDTIRMNLSRFYVKRCIALPGDTLRIVNGFYEVNGQRGYGNMEAQQWLSSIAEPNQGIRYTIPYNKSYKWDVKEFGPLLIPAKGSTTEINDTNFCLYKKQILYETHGQLKKKDGKIYLNDELLTNYTFTRNWYFMAGDNVLNSQDCRYLGPIPEEYIVGKVVLILSAKDRETKEYRWGRFLTRVR